MLFSKLYPHPFYVVMMEEYPYKHSSLAPRTELKKKGMLFSGSQTQKFHESSLDIVWILSVCLGATCILWEGESPRWSNFGQNGLNSDRAHLESKFQNAGFTLKLWSSASNESSLCWKCKYHLHNSWLQDSLQKIAADHCLIALHWGIVHKTRIATHQVLISAALKAM